LWERYLASEAWMPPVRIHREAHHREHGMTPEQVNELDAAPGHPLRDPHGDPILTRTYTFENGIGRQGRAAVVGRSPARSDGDDSTRERGGARALAVFLS
jgi:hypothetical protein